MARMTKVEMFAVIRRVTRLEGTGVRALARRYGIHRRTVREALQRPDRSGAVLRPGQREQKEDTFAAPQSRQNSLPSMSCIGMHDSLVPSASSVCTCTAPSATSRAHSAWSVARRSSPTSPVPTRTSRCSRFLTTFPSGTRWKYSRGPTPEGSLQANHESRCSGGCERLKSSQVANPPVAAVRRTPTPHTRTERPAQVLRSRR